MTPPLLQRHPLNPVVRPGGLPWRQAVTFNPAVIEVEGIVYLYERCAGNLRPFQCCIGLQTSTDGVHFTPAAEEPVIKPELLGSRHGSVQDPRIVQLGGAYYMTVAYRPFAWNSHPTGVGVPESYQAEYPEFDGDGSKNQTRSAILKSTNLTDWELLSWVSDETIDDRNVILFPEKIGGRYTALRRPQAHVGMQAEHAEIPSVQLSYSDDLLQWTAPEPILHPAYEWEDNRIGGSTPPLRTEAGWLLFYHGVQNIDTARKTVIYRMGAALLDLEDPRTVLARSPLPLLEPVEYYECTGLYIPNVVFPTASLLRDDTLWFYYGVCDTAIALATTELSPLLDYLTSSSCRL